MKALPIKHRYRINVVRIRSFVLLAAAAVCSFSCSNRVLLDERFNDARLIDWTVVDDPDTLEGPSEWRAGADGWLHQTSNVWGRRGDFIGRWYGTLLIAGSGDWTDYAFSVRAKPSDDDGFGVVFRYQDRDHFYRLLFLQDGMSGGPITRLDRREGADYTELWSNRTGYRTGSEMLIEVEVAGDVIGAKVDGRQLFETKDSSYSRGKIGLFCYAQKGQAFDDVRVTSR